jgi:hypothetical protein
MPQFLVTTGVVEFVKVVVDEDVVDEVSVEDVSVCVFEVTIVCS